MSELDIGGVFDDRPLSALQLRVILICALLGLLDGYDAQSIGFVAPSIARDWGLPPASFALIFAAGTVGSLCGSLPFGMVADRYGRRRGLIGALAVISASMTLTALARNPAELLVCRLLSGVGLGGMLPTLVALTAEYAPKRVRSFAVTAMFCSFPLGAVIGAIFASATITPHNWRFVFWLGAAAPALMLPIVIFALPESITWLARQGRERALGRALSRMDLTGTATDGLALEPAGRRAPFLDAVRQGRGLTTLSLSVACFASLSLIYLLVNWLPTFAVQSGATLGQSALSLALLNLSGIVGGLLIAGTSDRFASSRIVAASYLIGAFGVCLIPLLISGWVTIFIFAFVAGFFCIGAQMTLVALASKSYPVELRSTGVAIVAAAGRLGALAGPLIGGILVGIPDAGRALGLAVAAAAATAGIAVAVARTRIDKDQKVT